MNSNLSNFSFSQLFQTDSFNPQITIHDQKSTPSLLNISTTSNNISATSHSSSNSSNISRYEQQKSINKSRQIQLIMRLQANLQGLQNVDQKLKNWMEFKPIKTNKKKENNSSKKENKQIVH